MTVINFSEQKKSKGGLDSSLNIFNKNPKSNTNVTNDKNQSKKLVREPDKKKRKNRKVSWVQNDYLLFFLFILDFHQCVFY